MGRALYSFHRKRLIKSYLFRRSFYLKWRICLWKQGRMVYGACRGSHSKFSVIVCYQKGHLLKFADRGGGSPWEILQQATCWDGPRVGGGGAPCSRAQLTLLTWQLSSHRHLVQTCRGTRQLSRSPLLATCAWSCPGVEPSVRIRPLDQGSPVTPS